MSVAVMFQNMPPLSPEEYAALEASILEHGIQSPVTVDESGVIIDGHHRSKIASEHGLTVPKQVVSGKTDAEKRTLALSLNLDRRHLNREQRRALIAESVKADPQMSDREHARRTGVSPSTVGTVRSALEGEGQLSKLDSRVSADGRIRPATQPERLEPTFDPTPDWDPTTGEINPDPPKVTDRDSETYTRPEPKEESQPIRPRRRPISDAARDAGWEIRKATEKIEKLLSDDRYPQNREQVTLHLRGHLLYVVESCQGLLDQLD